MSPVPRPRPVRRRRARRLPSCLAGLLLLAGPLRTPAPATVPVTGAVRVLVAAADADRDGAVTTREWQALQETLGPTEDGHLDGQRCVETTLQRALDRDRDGRLTGADVQAALGALDADASGTLEDDELDWSPTALANGAGSRPAAPGPLAGVIALGADGDGDGRVDAAAQRRRPPLMPWQRSFEDAWSLVQSTGKPLLICVNTDGEPASETLADGRYRDADFVALVQGFIPVLASPDAHTVREHDGRGRRIVDPKFGRLLSSEHIDIEPTLYERFFGGTRVAPRHVGVAPDGTILFDIYLINDLSLIDAALREHGRFDVSLPDPAGLDEAGLLADPDAAARARLEARFLAAGEADRVRLATASLDPARSVQQPELLHLGLRDPSRAVRRAAVAAMAAHPLLAPLSLFAEAASVVAGDPDAVTALAAGLARRAEAGEGSDASSSRRLARILAGSLTTSAALDVDLWRLALAAEPPAPLEEAPPAEDSAPLFAAMGALDDRVSAAPHDARLRTLLAQAALRTAEVLIPTGSSDVGLVLDDARNAARQATLDDPSLGMAWAVLARADRLAGDDAEAGDAAAQALPHLLLQAAAPLTAQVLEALLQGRARTLEQALAADETWPGHWVADILAAERVLLLHPRATESQITAGLDVLIALELYAPQAELIHKAVVRFPESATLHAYLRWQVLRDAGAAGLVDAYGSFPSDLDASPDWAWYAGYGRLIAAEAFVEDAHPEQAIAAYQRSLEDFARAVALDPTFDNARLLGGLAAAGLARVHLDQGDLDGAAAALEEAARRSPEALARDDDPKGPAATLRAVLAALQRADRAAAAQALRDAVDGPDPGPDGGD